MKKLRQFLLKEHKLDDKRIWAQDVSIEFMGDEFAVSIQYGMPTNNGVGIIEGLCEARSKWLSIALDKAILEFENYANQTRK